MPVKGGFYQSDLVEIDVTATTSPTPAGMSVIEEKAGAKPIHIGVGTARVKLPLGRKWRFIGDKLNGWLKAADKILDLTRRPQFISQADPVVNLEYALLYNSEFVSHVTIPDRTRINPGMGFKKIWRIRNTGAATWDSSYRFEFVEGDDLGPIKTIALPGACAPGATIDLPVDMVGPAEPGIRNSNWQLRSSDGGLFGARVGCDPVLGQLKDKESFLPPASNLSS